MSKEYLSLLNPYSIKELWKTSKGQLFITAEIQRIIHLKGEYKLHDLFNDKLNTVRSYAVLESKKHIVIFEYLFKERSIDDTLAIYNFLEQTTDKKIYLIIFNNYYGKNNRNRNIINLYKDDSIWFADTKELQLKSNTDITNILYSMSDETVKLYNHENDLMGK